jgi:hypothetical protein
MHTVVVTSVPRTHAENQYTHIEKLVFLVFEKEILHENIYRLIDPFKSYLVISLAVFVS